MRNLKLLLLSVTSLFFFLDVFGQSASITQGCFPLTVQFTAPSGTSTYFWDFQDGSTSNLQNPSNTFTAAGTYVVEFSASSGGPVIGTVTINVYPKPTPTFTVDETNGCVNQTQFNFTNTTQVNQGITVTSYSWVFGDGGQASGANPTHVFTAAGNHYVSLQVNTNLASCNVTQIYNDVVSVTALPIASFVTNPSPALACVPPLNVSFTNVSSSGSALTYGWDMDNGNTYTDQTPPSQTYTTPGDYTVSLTVTDTNGCSRTTQRLVSIGQPLSSFSIPDTICLNAEYTLINNSSAGTYLWDFGPNAVQQYSTLTAPTVEYTSTGLQSITLQTSSPNGLCVSDTTIQVFVEDPVASFVSDPTYSCHNPMTVNFTAPNGFASYEWTFGNNETSTDQNPMVEYIVENETIYAIYEPLYYNTELIVTTNAGCKDTLIQTDTLDLPTARFMPDSVDGCVPLTVNFSDSSRTGQFDIVSWEWHFGDGTTITANSDADQTHTYTQVGEYDAYLIIVNSDGCTDTSGTIRIKVGDLLNVDFTASPLDVCPGDTIQLADLTNLADSIDSWHYSTEGGRSFSCFPDPNPTWVFNDETGPQDVTLTVSYNGCYSSTTKPAYVNVKGPIAKMDFTCNCGAPFDVSFSDSSRSATSLEWIFGDGNTSTDEDPIHTYSTTGDYQVILHATNASSGCADSYDTAMVYIRDIQASFTSDSIFCQSIPEDFDASASVDVHEYCDRGYTWYFSDPGSRPITTDNPTEPIQFPVTGNNTVTLVVTDINGCKDTATTDVLVYGVVADFNMDDSLICLPGEVTFTDLSTSDTTITNWNWSFGNGDVSTDQSPVYTYPAFQDTFFVSLITINELGCQDTLYDTITTYQISSIVSTVPLQPNICTGNSVNFSATDYTQGGSNLSFAWDFADGGTSALQNPSHVFNDPGPHQVTMVYTEVGSGCMDSVNAIVNVQAYPEASFSLPPELDTLSVFCSPQNVSFQNTTTPVGTFLSWNFGNGNVAGNQQQVSTVYTSGSYVATLTATTTYGCSDTYTDTFIVVGPEGNFFIDKDTICRGEEIVFTLTDTSEVNSFTWDFGDGNTESNVSPVGHTYTFVPPSGQTVAKLIVSSIDGECPLSIDTPIYIHEVVADFIRNDGVDTSLCFQPFPFTNSSLNSDVFYWNFGDGTTFTSTDPPIHTYPAPGTYEVTLGVRNNTLGCTDTIVKTVILHPIPEVTAVGDTVCEGDIGFLSIGNPISGAQYNWTSEEDISNPNQPDASSQPSLSALYTVEVIDTNGCINSDSTFIRVINPPSLVNWDTAIVIGDSINLPLTLDPTLYNFEWNPEEGLSCLDCAPPVVQPLEDIVYDLIVTDVLGCFETGVTYTITIYPETFIKMPTTFTPNGDGPNDIVYVEGWGIKDLLEFQIYNRWGQLIFETSDLEEGWDGYYNGILQNNDVYVYKVRALTWRDEEQTLEGYINLMR